MEASRQLKRRSSFYSGGESRNCQRARTKMLLKRLQNRSASGNGKSPNRVHIEHGLDKDDSFGTDKNFLFSRIVSSAPQVSKTVFSQKDHLGCSSSSMNLKPGRKGMKRILNFDDIGIENQPPAKTVEDSPRRTRSGSCETAVGKSTPVKRITRNLSFAMTTPTKNNDSYPDDLTLAHFNHLSKTPKRNESVLSYPASSPFLTPSKRVQFSLHHTPSKNSVGIFPSTTPKSILKTPNKNNPSKARTPLRGALFGANTPTRRIPLQIARTPNEKQSNSPDLFSSVKKCDKISPNKTPTKLCASPLNRRCSPRLKSPENRSVEKLPKSPLAKSFNSLSRFERRSSRVLNFASISGISPDKSNRTPVDVSSVNTNTTKMSSTPMVGNSRSNSSDSAICMDKNNFPSETDVASLSPLNIDINDTDSGVPKKLSEDELPSYDKEVNTVEDFMKTLDSLADGSVGDEDFPDISNQDIEFINSLIEQDTNQEATGDQAVTNHDGPSKTNSLNVCCDISQNTAESADQSVNIDESCDVSHNTEQDHGEPLLDLPAMADRSDGGIVMNKSWRLDDSGEETSSPEIEISPSVRKYVQKKYIELKTVSVPLEPIDSSHFFENNRFLPRRKTSTRRTAQNSSVQSDDSDSEEEGGRATTNKRVFRTRKEKLLTPVRRSNRLSHSTFCGKTPEKNETRNNSKGSLEFKLKNKDYSSSEDSDLDLFIGSTLTAAKKSIRSSEDNASDNKHFPRKYNNSLGLLSTSKIKAPKNLRVEPLQSIENIPEESTRKSRRCRQPTSYVDYPSDLSEMESSKNDTVNSLRMDLADTASSSQNVDISNIQEEHIQDTEVSVKPELKKSIKTKRKKVKLKLKKKSKDCYEVSQNISVTTNTASETERSAEKKVSKKSLKKDNNGKFLTPLRFTRHMSKDISLTPEVFNKITTGSPGPSNAIDNTDTPSTPTQQKSTGKKTLMTPSSRKNLWRVESPSPTMKKFFRVPQGSPVPNSPSNPLSPSVKSLLHLSTSPLIQKNRPSEAGSSTQNHVGKRTALKRKRSETDDEIIEKTKDLDAEVATPPRKTRRSIVRRISSEDLRSPIRLAQFTERRVLKPRSSKRLYAE